MGENIGEHVDEHAVEDRGEDWGEDRGEGAIDEDRLSICFQHSSRKCRCSWFFDENTISQCLQDGLLYTSSYVCQISRAIEENKVLYSLQWWYLISCGAFYGGLSGGPFRGACDVSKGAFRGDSKGVYG